MDKSLWQRVALLGVASLVLAPAAHAQITGPTPLAWRWSAPTPLEPTGSPLISGDRVYVAVGRRVYCVDRASGNEIWRFPKGEPIESTFTLGVALINGVIVAAANNKLVYALDASSGESLWSWVSPSTFQSSPLPYGENVVLTLGDGSYMALEVKTGRPVYAEPRRVFEGIQGRSMVYQSSLLVFTNSNKLLSLDLATGRQNWSQTFVTIPGGAQPVVFGSRVFVNSGTFVVALNGASGTIAWQRDTTEALAYNPVVTATRILVLSQLGSVFVYDTNGSRVNRNPFNLMSQPIAPPTAVEKLVVVPTSNGAITLADPVKGEILWSFPIPLLPGAIVGRPTAGAGGPGRGGGVSAPGGPGGPGGGNQNNDLPPFVSAAGPVVLDGATLFVLARDGSLLSFDSSQGVDLTPPTLRMIYPNSGDNINGGAPLQLIFRVQDEATGIKASTIKVTINDQETEHRFLPEGYIVVDVGEGKNPPLSDGRKTIKVVAADWLGNTRTAQYALLIDNSLPRLVRPGSQNTGPGGPGGPGGGGGGRDGGR